MDSNLYTSFNFLPSNIVVLIGFLILVLMGFVLPGLIKIILKLIDDVNIKLNMILDLLDKNKHGR